MPTKDNRVSAASPAKEVLDETVITEKERDLLINSIGFLLMIIHKQGIQINADPAFTRHVCSELTSLAVRLQYEGVPEKEIH